MGEEQTRSLLISTISPAFFGAFFGIAGTIFASTLGYLNKDRELDLEMVRLSVTILSTPTSAADNDLQRRFAVYALRQFSGVNMSDADLDAWAKTRGSLPRVTNIAEVCGEVASTYANSAYFSDDDAKADAARALDTLYNLGCTKPPS